MKKKLSALLLASLLCLMTACGPAPSNEQVPTLPGEYPMELTFSSGAGAWRTFLFLNADGTFTGEYSDSDMGDADEAYPNGTFYFCSFSGQFEVPAPTDSYATPLHLVGLTCNDDVPEEEIRDGIRYIHAGPHGFYSYETGVLAETFVFYTPDTPVAELSEEMLSWWPSRFEEETPDTLGCYALWIGDAGTAFFS